MIVGAKRSEIWSNSPTIHRVGVEPDAMTGRSSPMDAPRASLRGSHRAACVAVGLLCALGLLSGVVLRAGDAAHQHRTPAVAASITTLADGHGAAARGEHHLAATAPANVAAG